MPEALAVLAALTAQIWEIFLEISSVICLEAAEEDVRRTGLNEGRRRSLAVYITFEEAVFGCEKELELNLKDTCNTCHGTGAKPGTSPETCSKCHGSGQIVYTQQSMFGTIQNVQTCPDCQGTGKVIKEKCPDCRGTGFISSRKKIKVTIPAGIDNGQSIRIRDKGEPGLNGRSKRRPDGRSDCCPPPDFPTAGYEIPSPQLRLLMHRLLWAARLRINCRR